MNLKIQQKKIKMNSLKLSKKKLNLDPEKDILESDTKSNQLKKKLEKASQDNLFLI